MRHILKLIGFTLLCLLGSFVAAIGYRFGSDYYRIRLRDRVVNRLSAKAKKED